MDIQEFLTTHFKVIEFKRKYLPQMSDSSFQDKLRGFRATDKKQVFFKPQEIQQIRTGFDDLNTTGRKILKSLTTVKKIQFVFQHEITGQKLSFASVIEAAEALEVSRALIYQQLKNNGLVAGYSVSKVQKSK